VCNEDGQFLSMNGMSSIMEVISLLQTKSTERYLPVGPHRIQHDVTFLPCRSHSLDVSGLSPAF
jgi:hypothetical protein